MFKFYRQLRSQLSTFLTRARVASFLCKTTQRENFRLLETQKYLHKGYLKNNFYLNKYPFNVQFYKTYTSFEADKWFSNCITCTIDSGGTPQPQTPSNLQDSNSLVLAPQPRLS